MKNEPRVPEPDPNTMSNWLRDALRGAAGLDPVDVANDAEYLAAYLRQGARDWQKSLHEVFAAADRGEPYAIAYLESQRPGESR